MRRHLPITALLLSFLAFWDGAAATPEERAARQCAATFGQALLKADVTLLRPILPSRGKVEVRLERLGFSQEGYFSAAQVEALFQDFLKHGKVRSFELLRVECDREGHALVRGRAELTERTGRQRRSEIHLKLEPEGANWVLRGIRESKR